MVEPVYILSADKIMSNEKSAYPLNSPEYNRHIADPLSSSRGVLEKIIQKRTKEKIAYMFIDPLIDYFEASNSFYFNIFGLKEPIPGGVRTFKSGAGPIHAINEAKRLIDSKQYDAAVIYGHDPLKTMQNDPIYGRDRLLDAMEIFPDRSVPKAYHDLSHKMIDRQGITEEQFMSTADALFHNYWKTYQKKHTIISKKPGRDDMLEIGKAEFSDILKRTDSANPFVDFTGGIIIGKQSVADAIDIPLEERIEILGVSSREGPDGPEHIDDILGTGENIYPMIMTVFGEASKEAGVDFAEESLLEKLQTAQQESELEHLLAIDETIIDPKKSSFFDKFKDYVFNKERLKGIAVVGGTIAGLAVFGEYLPVIEQYIQNLLPFLSNDLVSLAVDVVSFTLLAPMGFLISNYANNKDVSKREIAGQVGYLGALSFLRHYVYSGLSNFDEVTPMNVVLKAALYSAYYMASVGAYGVFTDYWHKKCSDLDVKLKECLPTFRRIYTEPELQKNMLLNIALMYLPASRLRPLFASVLTIHQNVTVAKTADTSRKVGFFDYLKQLIRPVY
ncbi:MAG: hypothetical protein KKF44_03095 [Nanoarchaeota archaeon]|nr:hypothetical protein [Nanoarchaeota archaeon]